MRAHQIPGMRYAAFASDRYGNVKATTTIASMIRTLLYFHLGALIGTELRWEVVVVPGVGHSSKAMSRIAARMLLE
jgi:imidazoleglycerol phosphate synthase glutamine amidotransferase subunit HisH